MLNHSDCSYQIEKLTVISEASIQLENQCSLAISTHAYMEQGTGLVSDIYIHIRVLTVVAACCIFSCIACGEWADKDNATSIAEELGHKVGMAQLGMYKVFVLKVSKICTKRRCSCAVER